MTHSYNEAHDFGSRQCFSTQENFKLFASSWNVGGITPPNSLKLEELLDAKSIMADIYVLGFQEIVPLKAKNIFIREKSKNSTKWNSLIEAVLNKRISTEDKMQKACVGKTQGNHSIKSLDSINLHAQDFVCIISKQMVGIYITAWVRADIHDYISHTSVSYVGCGLLSCLGNKGSVSIRFYLHETSFCFVCSHLAAGGRDGDEKKRNVDAARTLSHTLFPAKSFQYLPRTILDHDQVIWLGDLNYRIYLPEDMIRDSVNNKEWSYLLENDQLRAEMRGGIFNCWHENEIEFAPTYKYSQNSDDYFRAGNKIKAKTRAPAWCDRIIWYGEGLKQLQYNRGEFRLSDHRPVHATFMADVKVSRPLKTSVGIFPASFVDSYKFASSINV